MLLKQHGAGDEPLPHIQLKMQTQGTVYLKDPQVSGRGGQKQTNAYVSLPFDHFVTVTVEWLLHLEWLFKVCMPN